MSTGISGSFDSKTGTIKVHIDDGGSLANVEIASIGNLKYEFDLLPDSPDVESVKAIYNKIDITIYQHSYAQDDLYDRIRNNSISQDGLKVTLTIVDGVNEDDFQFFIKVNDIKLSLSERLIKLVCRVLYDEDATALSVFDEIPAGVTETFRPDDSEAGEELDCTGVLDWIEYAMKKVFVNDLPAQMQSCPTNLGTNYQSENFTSFDGFPTGVTFLMAKMDDPPFTGFDLGEDAISIQGSMFHDGNGYLTNAYFPEYWQAGDGLFEVRTSIGQPIYSGPVEIDEVVSSSQIFINTFSSKAAGRYIAKYRSRYSTANIKAVSTLQEIAAIEGAIFGTGFGKNFYVNRIQQNDVVEIEWDDIEDSDIETFFNPLGGGFVYQIAKTVKNITGGSAGDYELNEGPPAYGTWPVSTGNWEVPTITDGKVTVQKIEGIEQEVNLTLAPGYPFLSKAWGDNVNNRLLGRYDESTGIWFLDYDPVLTLCRTGLNSIQRSLSSDGRGIIVEFKAFGAKSIMPWNLVKIVNGPSRYNNRLFRPTSLDYDFVLDTVGVKAYEILDSDLPD